MTFAFSATTWLAISVGVAAAATVHGVEQTRKAGSQAKDAAKATALQAERANNKANAKRPDSAAAMRAAIMAGKAGNSSTLLTGPQGIDTTQLTLGRMSLLGGGGG